jgi:acetaldehyde dehydrogenase/alcohol dehydrogenase
MPNSPTTKKFDDLVKRVKIAQEKYAKFTQEQVDEIVFQAALAANHARVPLAKEAVEETGMGIVEDKVIKNHFASEFIYNKYRNAKTCGIIEHDEVWGLYKIADSMGIVAGITPTTNPTSTTIFKALLALKTRNGIIFSPHPRAKKCSAKAAKIVLDAAVKAGAPPDIIGWIEEPSIELTQQLMGHPDIAIILATGGPGLVKAAYSSGKPAIGVGPGNTPAIIDETADITMAISSIILSKTFDNGTICASEQSIVVVDTVYDKVKQELTRQGAYILKPDERKKLAKTIIIDGRLNPKIVGQPAHTIAKLADLKVPEKTKMLVAEVEKVGTEEPFSYEKLSPVIALYKTESFEKAVARAEELLEYTGLGHTATLYTDEANQDRIEYFGEQVKTARILINIPGSQGAIGDVYNFRLEPSLTLGCGTYGGNSVSGNIGVKDLLNIKTIAERRENMLWFRIPPKVYFKYGCLPEVLSTFKMYKRAFIICDRTLFELGHIDKITEVLKEMGVSCEIFNEVLPDPTLSLVKKGLARAKDFKPDIILSYGGGSPIDAGKIIWLLYDYPEIQFEDLAMRFMDINKRIYSIAEKKEKTLFVAIPTTSGTGSEVTPFAVITDDAQGNTKYPIADYAITPNIAIVDPSVTMQMPKGLTAASGYDAITHAIEALVSVVASDFSNAMAKESLELLFEYLPAAYKEGAKNPLAREKVHYAATMAGMAFANAYLGVGHSMAHKLGAAFHITHGVANAILLPHIIRYNATDVPRKLVAFPQYKTPEAIKRYANIADVLEIKGKTDMDKVEAFIKALEKLREELDIPATIKAAGIDKKIFLAQVDKLAELAFDDQCTGTNPRYPLIEEIREIYLAAYE